MQKHITKGLLFLAFVLVAVMGLSACRPPEPPNGVWYCEELRLEIDLNTFCGKQYNVDGTCRNVQCLFSAFDNHMVVFAENGEEQYLSGHWRYMFWKDLFTVTTSTDEHTYVFKRIDNSQ